MRAQDKRQIPMKQILISLLILIPFPASPSENTTDSFSNQFDSYCLMQVYTAAAPHKNSAGLFLNFNTNLHLTATYALSNSIAASLTSTLPFPKDKKYYTLDIKQLIFQDRSSIRAICLLGSFSYSPTFRPYKSYSGSIYTIFTQGTPFQHAFHINLGLKRLNYSIPYDNPGTRFDYLFGIGSEFKLIMKFKLLLEFTNITPWFPDESSPFYGLLGLKYSHKSLFTELGLSNISNQLSPFDIKRILLTLGIKFN